MDRIEQTRGVITRCSPVTIVVILGFIVVCTLVSAAIAFRVVKLFHSCQTQFFIDFINFLIVEKKKSIQLIMRRPIIIFLLIGILMINCPEISGRRGRARSRSKSRVQIGLPITGKYRDPEADQYYNNNNGAKILQASHFDLEYVLGHKIAFLCVAKGSPRPHITWFKDGAEIFIHLYLHVHEWVVKNDTVKSKLEIDPATQMDAGVYECTADNMYSIDRRSFKTDFSIAFD